METRSTRRSFLLGSAAAVGSLGLLKHASGVTLAPGASVPTVDSLSIKVVMDSSHDIFVRGQAPKAVRVRRAPPADDFRRTLHNVWGLALALESKAGADTRRVMLDFGYTADTLLNNIDLLKVDPARFDALIVSHGHFDHFGGLVGFLEKYRGSMKPDMTLYVGGEDNFCVRLRRTPTPGHFAEWGTLDRREISARQLNLVLCEKPTVIADHAFTTGAIRRAGIEKVLPNTMVQRGMKDGVGCNVGLEHFTEAEKSGKPAPDEHIHEHATCYNLKDRGLVVLNSCGHAGILNSIRQAMEVSGVNKLHALVGGFHLAPAPEDYLKQVVAQLRDLNPDVVIPMHCSGTNFIQEVQRQMPDRLALSTTGSEFTLGA